jgi:hypothetical protein
MTTSNPVRPTMREVLNRFFFSRETPYGMALMRIFLPWSLLINVFQRWAYVRELYSADGAPAPLADNFGFPGFLPELPGGVAVALYTALTFLLITSSLGWCTRFSLVASMVLYTYFGMLDCMSTIAKYTVIGTHLLLLLGVSQSGLIWSVDSWWRRRNGWNPTDDELKVDIWPQRLVQLLIGSIYFGAAITKIHTPAFFSGDQLMYWMMTYINNEHPLGDWLSQYPLVLTVFSYITILWEIVFLFTVFQPRLKWWVLFVGAMFHLMTVFTLGLIVFPLVMAAAYMPFLSEAEVTWLGKWRFFRRDYWFSSAEAAPATASASSDGWQHAVIGSAVFSLVLVAVSAGGVGVEHWIDPYCLRGPDGPLPLREMSQEEADHLFGPEIPLRHVDKLVSFDLGTIAVGEHLLNRRTEFTHGDRMIAHATFAPPHEDMWIDCQLIDAVEKPDDEGNLKMVPGTTITKLGQVVPRETSRVNFFFKLAESVEPGEYFLRLRCSNDEIALRRFTLRPSKASAGNAN